MDESDSDHDWSIIDDCQTEEGRDVQAGFDAESRMSRSLDFDLGDGDLEHYGTVSPTHHFPHSLECSGVEANASSKPGRKSNGVSAPVTPTAGAEPTPGAGAGTSSDMIATASPESNQGDKIATKIKSAWHNIRFGNYFTKNYVILKVDLGLFW